MKYSAYKYVYLLILLIGFNYSAKACSCFPYEANFYNNVSIYTYNCIAVFDTLDYNYVFGGLASQTSYFTLIDTINSNPSTIGNRIVVLGQDGINCGESLFGLNRGDTIVLALYDGWYENYVSDTFYLEGVCGKHYIKIQNGQYNGLTISKIKDKILDIISSTELLKNLSSIKIYPNPTKDLVFISVNPLILQGISVFDITGNLIINRKEENEDIVSIDFSHFNSGVYILIIKTDKGIVTRKAIKL